MSASRFSVGERIEFSSLGNNSRHVFRGVLRRFCERDFVVVKVDDEASERFIRQERLRKSCAQLVSGSGGEAA